MKARKVIQNAYDMSPRVTLTHEERSAFIDELYLPYTHAFENHEDFLEFTKDLPRFSYPDERNGGIFIRKDIDFVIYIILAPKQDELDKIEAFAKIKDKSEKLSLISKLQRDLRKKGVKIDCFNEIKKEIKNLYEDVLEINKSETLKQKEFLSDLNTPTLEKTNKINKENKLHQSIFEDGAFSIFLKWIEINKQDKQFKSISFIFQKLKEENKLRNTTFKVLIEWTYENEFIDYENYKTLTDAGSFNSPTKILSKGRLNLYSTIIDN
ncbi:hypothetical protein PL373_01635 [Tenacibaculum maritimum]|nr:hypothetical protein [Tenacibaculum maritimum]MDB0599873.1 hypothetical protein [Tenacibaculum maritimum]MDB0610984.1 hypothetical protein [Tenacibaculum maritimum]